MPNILFLPFVFAFRANYRALRAERMPAFATLRQMLSFHRNPFTISDLAVNHLLSLPRIPAPRS